MLLERHWGVEEGFVVIRTNDVPLLTNTNDIPIHGLTLRRLRQSIALQGFRRHLLCDAPIDKLNPVREYILLESELVPAPCIMACKETTLLRRLTTRRNWRAERVAKRLHFVVPAEGIFGEVIIAHAPPDPLLMSPERAQALLYGFTDCD